MTDRYHAWRLFGWRVFGWAMKALPLACAGRAVYLVLKLETKP